MSPEELATIRERHEKRIGAFCVQDRRYLLAVIDGIRTYIESIETPYNDEEVLDRIYEMVGGQP